jgi:excisionase family DNA binding protein
MQIGGNKTPMLSVAAIAAQLSISEKTVRRAIANGELTFHRVRRQIRCTPAQVQAFIAAR